MAHSKRKIAAIEDLVTQIDACTNALTTGAAEQVTHAFRASIAEALRVVVADLQAEISFPTMREAVAALSRFGHAFARARNFGADQDGDLVEQVQALLALLTNQAATPEDVEAVLPYRAVLTDA
jgi:hypothetical protein